MLGRTNRRQVFLMLKAREFRHDSAVIEAKAQQIIRKLRRYHHLGQPGDPKKRRSTVELAAKSGIGVNTAFKARAFARLYTQSELDALCRRRRPDDLPLNWAYVPYLLTVKDKRQRAQFEMQAAKLGWTAPELYAEIRRKLPTQRKPGGGWPPNRPRISGSGLSRIIQESKTWLRYCEAIRPALTARRREKGLQRDIEKREQAIIELRRVARSAEEVANSLAKDLAAGKRRRPSSRPNRSS